MSNASDRRQLIAGLGAVATAAGLGGRVVAAQGSSTPFTPARHPQDDWMGAMPGKHRVVLDVTSPEHMPDGIRFANNLFNGHKSGYGVEEADLALIMVIRHAATGLGYDNALWAKYGKSFDRRAETPPTANPFDSGERVQLSALAKKGVQFLVCATASRGIATGIAGQGGDVDAVMKEMGAHLITNGRLSPAGVIGVTHAQEHGFTLLYVG